MNPIRPALSRRELLMVLSAAAGLKVLPAWAAENTENAQSIPPQPYFASVMRAVAALAAAGQPVAMADAERLAALAAQRDANAIAAAERILDRYTLVRVTLDKDGSGKPTLGGAERVLIEQGWTSFLIRVSNPHGWVTKLGVASSRSGAGRMSQANLEEKAGLRDSLFKAPLIEKLWLSVQPQATQSLSGAPLDYQVLEVFSRDRGQRRGSLGFGTGGTVNWGGVPKERAALAAFLSPFVVEFTARPTQEVTLSVLDGDGAGCMASLIIKDAREHIYPPQTMRLAPDMFFHPHIYRADGETVRLPDGEYSVTTWRGPEYLRRKQTVRVMEGQRRISIQLKRWIDPVRWGWYSGDTHIHAAGCAHYMHPTEGVNPETMIRHVRGEALAIGDVLTWGPAWYHQKQFFTGHAISPDAALEYPELQAANNAGFQTKSTPKDRQSLLRYDIEVSQFPSSMSGHLILLRLKDQNYPGTQVIEDWPSWNLPISQWGRQQGAVAGFAHCVLAVSTRALPNYEVPTFESVGANEAVVDVTHGACDFLSGCELEPAWELNLWYHLLNCGFRLAMLGETDYPCISGERPGMGRSYIQLDQRPVDDAGYNAWVEAIKTGRLYCGDGRSHFLKYAIGGKTFGETVKLARAGSIVVEATVAARLEPEFDEELMKTITEGWHIERARIGRTRTVPLELVVNGQAMERMEFLADGEPRAVRFKTRIERSSWVALRILPSGHTHPIFVSVAGKPIRASRRSAEWLRQCVDALWNEKHRLMRESERPAAAEAYDHARKAYERIIAESDIA